MMSCARYFCIFGGDTNLNKEERSLFSMQFHPEGIQLEQGRAIPYLSTFLKLIYIISFISMRYTSHSSMEPDRCGYISLSCVPACLDRARLRSAGLDN